jgi:hypothetical protein
MGTVSLTLPSDGTTGEVADYNTPLTTLANEFNGNIDNNNIKAGAAIDGAKLADSGVTVAKVADKAVTSRKAQLTTLGASGLTVNPIPTTTGDVGSSSVTFTCDVASYLIITYGATLQVNGTAGAVDAQILVNLDTVDTGAAAYTRTDALGAGKNVYIAISKSQRLTLTAGAHTIKLRAVSNTASAAVATETFWWGLLVAQP